MVENKTTFTNLKTKMSFQGEIGKSVDFDYHIPSGRYYEKGTEVPTYCLIEEKEIEVKETPEPIIYKASLTDAFGNIEDENYCPF